jgi:hypothetical protein
LNQYWIKIDLNQTLSATSESKIKSNPNQVDLTALMTTPFPECSNNRSVLPLDHIKTPSIVFIWQDINNIHFIHLKILESCFIDEDSLVTNV